MSKETKFTKGEWSIAEGRTYCAVKQVSTGIVVADMRTVNGNYKASDAHLIKTAPEMYDLLMTIENDSDQVPAWLWNKIQLTLKKARGE